MLVLMKRNIFYKNLIEIKERGVRPSGDVMGEFDPRNGI